MTLIVFNSCEEEDDETGMIVQEMVEITSGCDMCDVSGCLTIACS